MARAPNPRAESNSVPEKKTVATGASVRLGDYFLRGIRFKKWNECACTST
jgi:hypothetical protein